MMIKFFFYFIINFIILYTICYFSILYYLILAVKNRLVRIVIPGFKDVRRITFGHVAVDL